jgi:predicted transcriptional regulator
MSPTLQSPVFRRPSAAGRVRNGRPVAQARAASKAEPRWTFLTNHAHVLIVLSKNPSTVLREVALRVGITERAVQRIIADLERDGFIEREKVGRQNSYRLRAKQPLRHPIEAHRSIGDLIDLI